MAQKKKIVIEDENEHSKQDTPSTPSDSDADADEPADSPDPMKAIEEQLAAAQAEAGDHRDRMLRMAAELENFKKRSAREQDELKNMLPRT